jgi:hypothetical protein
MSLPWEDLADAWAEMEEAAHNGTPNLKALTWQKYKEARDRLYLAAATILAAAVGAYSGIDGETPISGYVTDDVWRKIAEKCGFDLAVDKAQEAARLARAALDNPFGVDVLDDLAALKARLADLERRVDNLTPTIGEPDGRPEEARKPQA